MTKDRKFLLGSALAGALLLCGAANAQDYDNDSNAWRSSASESVIVRPTRPLGVIQHDSLLGPHAGSGSLYSERVSLSEAVNYSDLDLARVSDRRELRLRIADTATNICSRLVPEERGAFDQDQTQLCVTTAMRDALRQIPEG